MEKLYLQKGHEIRIWKGHPWVFSNELAEIPQLDAGTVVEILDRRNNSFGLGLYNPHSLIAVRLLNTNDLPDMDFFRNRLLAANDFRKRIYPSESTYRLVFGESDFLPGLIIDKYGEYFTIQILSAGMEKLKPEIIQALLGIYPNTAAIIQKNNSRLRQIEGLSTVDEFILGEIPDSVAIVENGIKFSISLKEGQKTGYYLDQRENRLSVRRFAKGLTVLDCFTNQGGFALNAAIGGAMAVDAVDYSQEIINMAKENSKLNNVNINFKVEDVFEYLTKAVAEGKEWDMIILDPPAFTKSKKNVDKAIAGYARLNKLAIKAVKSDGYLVTSSCSQHIPEEVFYRTVTNEGIKQMRQPRLIFRGMQAPDHPVLAPMPETSYLKFLVFEM